MATMKRVLTGFLGGACGLVLVILTSGSASAQSPFYPLVEKPVPRTLPNMVTRPKNFKIRAFATPRLGPPMTAGAMVGPHVLTLKPWRAKYLVPQPLYGPNLP